MFGDINGGIRIIRKLCASKNQPIHQKLIIKHGNLKKLSLWGCSAIDVSLGIYLHWYLLMVIYMFIFDKVLTKLTCGRLCM
jgi:hypothetical protein